MYQFLSVFGIAIGVVIAVATVFQSYQLHVEEDTRRRRNGPNRHDEGRLLGQCGVCTSSVTNANGLRGECGHFFHYSCYTDRAMLNAIGDADPNTHCALCRSAARLQQRAEEQRALNRAMQKKRALERAQEQAREQAREQDTIAIEQVWQTAIKDEEARQAAARRDREPARQDVIEAERAHEPVRQDAIGVEQEVQQNQVQNQQQAQQPPAPSLRQRPSAAAMCVYCDIRDPNVINCLPCGHKSHIKCFNEMRNSSLSCPRCMDEGLASMQ